MACANLMVFGAGLFLVSYMHLATADNRTLTREKRQISTSMQFQCPGTTRNFQDPTDCSYFYSCVNNFSTRVACQQQTFFDPTIGRCGFNTNIVGCTMLSSPSVTAVQPTSPMGPYRCPAVSGMFQDSSDCSKYYFCNNFISQTVTCQPGQVFYSSTHQCRTPSSPTDNPPGCFMQRTDSRRSSICKTPSGSYQDPSDCSNYYSCTNYNPVMVYCGSGLVFDPVAQTCVTYRTIIGCIMPPQPQPQPPTTTGSYTCRSPNGKFVDTSDCSHYYDCVNGVATLRSCPPEQLFDASIHLCGTNDHPPGCHIPNDWGRQGTNPTPTVPVVQPVGGIATPEPVINPITTFTCRSPNGNFQDATDCSHFYVCTDSIVRRWRCGSGMYFHPTTNNCDSSAPPSGCVVAGGNIPRPPTPPRSSICQAPYGSYQNTLDCSSYYRCTNYQAQLIQCQSNTLFNPLTFTCQSGIQPQGCTSPYTPPTPFPGPGPLTVSCPQGSKFASLVAHPTYCNAFYMCGDGRVYAPCIFCGYGQYFDPMLMRCVRVFNSTSSVCGRRQYIAHNQKVAIQAQGC